MVVFFFFCQTHPRIPETPQSQETVESSKVHTTSLPVSPWWNPLWIQLGRLFPTHMDSTLKINRRVFCGLKMWGAVCLILEINGSTKKNLAPKCSSKHKPGNSAGDLFGMVKT